MEIKIVCAKCEQPLHTWWFEEGELAVQPCECHMKRTVNRGELGTFIGKDCVSIDFIKKSGERRVLTGHLAGYADGGSRMYFYDSTESQLKSIFVNKIVTVTADDIEYEVID